MKKPILALLILTAAGICVLAQQIPEIDPEAMKLLQQYQQQNNDMPPEIAALAPPGLPLTQKEWSVESSQKMRLQADLVCHADSTKIENTEGYTLDLHIVGTAYNANSVPGKMILDQSLSQQRKQVQENWTSIHPAKKEGHITWSQPEKIVVPKGYILIQRIDYAAHHEGEGMVPARVEYCGFLYMELENGWLWAEVQPLPNTKAGIDKWLKHVNVKAALLDPKKYFK